MSTRQSSNRRNLKVSATLDMKPPAIDTDSQQLKPARDAKGEQWLVLHLQEAVDVGYKVATGQAAMLRPFGLNLLQRLIIRPLDDTLSPGPLQHAEWVDAQVRISLLEAHARIAVEPEGGAGGGGFEHSKQSFAIVKQLQQPHLRTLLQQWVALLRDHAVLHNVPPDIVSRYTPALVSSRAATAVEPVRGHYEAAWACVLDAATCCASVPPAHGAAADPTDVCLTPDDYNLLLAVSQLAVLRTIFAACQADPGVRGPRGAAGCRNESPGPGGSGQLFALEASPIAKGSGRGKGTWRSELRVMQALVRLTAPGYHATGYLEPGSAVEVLALLTEVVQSTNQPPLAAFCAAVLHNLVGPPVSGAAGNKAALVQDRQVLEVRLGNVPYGFGRECRERFGGPCLLACRHAGRTAAAGASSPAEGPSGQQRWANQCVALVLPHTILYSQGLLSSAPASGLEPEDVKTTGKVLKLVLLALTLAKDDRGSELASLQVLLMMVISIAKHTGAAAQLSTTAAHMLTRLASTHSEVFKASVQTLPPAAKQYLQAPPRLPPPQQERVEQVSLHGLPEGVC
ncbi:hypothetical protein CYMTET_44140 [Cymbomonas tetramitiformis]|uniref:Uncharacterized protein n=1 Tax=Cymbomonas tetramitiformis TaxID=36881 RepID=A0AAE0C243_9CHLO|nr:hypothetical protein CYMTET_44140 [Cymbomonas tetramitiformis]